MTKLRFEPFRDTQQRFDRLMQTIGNAYSQCSTDEGMDLYFDMCTIECQALTRDMAIDLDTILQNVYFFPEEDVFQMDLCKMCRQVDKLRGSISKRKSDTPEGRLRIALKELMERLGEMNTAMDSPTEEKRERMLRQSLDHYNKRAWRNDFNTFRSKTLFRLNDKKNPQKQSNLLSRELDRTLTAIYDSDFLRSRKEDYDGNGEEAYQSLRSTDNPERLDMQATADYVFANHRAWGKYDIINQFFKLHKTVCVLQDEIAKSVTSQKEAALRNARQGVMRLALKLEEYAADAMRYRQVWDTLLKNDKYLTVLLQKNLNEDYNLKLVLNTIGILITDGILTCNVNQANGLLFGKTRRNDYMTVQHYSNFDSDKSALTQELMETMRSVHLEA